LTSGGTPRRNLSTKPFSRGDNLRDVLAAYDVLVAHRGVDASAIAAVGSSYEGYLGAILTSLRGVRWLALRAPALYNDADWELPGSKET
jgi:hypothetical protein